ncbi:MAG TPA: uroporphyrinogen decarboxylase family protein [bacterium]|nr:uroporphyrinogen decarboxylase family protein [bacterium]HOM27096.1 uroporphyrinogen decarboxylase family protein [bacterium]
MNKRERVERTLNLKEVDRVPVYDLVRNDDVFEYFSGEKLPPEEMWEKEEEKLKIIAGKVVNKLCDMTRSFGFGPLKETDYTDEFGFVWHSSPYEKTSWIVKRPFYDEKDGIEFIKKLIIKYSENIKEIKSNQKAYREKYHNDFLKTQSYIGDTINLLAEQGTGLDLLRHYLGFEFFSYIYAENPDIISEFFEVYTDLQVLICHTIADRNLSPCVLTYGDIACKNMLLHSPQFLRKEFFPRLKKIQDAWHQYNIKCLFHSDGNIMEVLDDLIETGIDGLNPIEIVAGMDIKKIKEKYGNKIFLTGGIDMSQLLSLKTTEEVKEKCIETIKICYPGYFIGSTTEIDNSVKLENIIVMYEIANQPVEKILK